MKIDNLNNIKVDNNTNQKIVMSKEYKSVFRKSDGLALRWGKTRDTSDDPFMSPMPELIDLCITKRCTMGCPYCYANSGPNEPHMSMLEFDRFLSQLPDTCQQIALGGGNPNCHPDFPTILKMIKDKGVVPNYTTNGLDLTDDIVTASKAYCGAIAVSQHRTNIMPAIKLLSDEGIKTNIQYVVNNDTIQRFDKDEMDTYLTRAKEAGCFAVIFLLHKPQGRSSPIANVQPGDKLNEFLHYVENRRQIKNSVGLGFDSCFMTGVMTRTKLDRTLMDSCEAGRFSCFVDYELSVYPCSFYNRGESTALNLKITSFEDIWYGKFFVEWRQKFRNQVEVCSPNCFNETMAKECLGGCPIFKDINLCEKKISIK